MAEQKQNEAAAELYKAKGEIKKIKSKDDDRELEIYCLGKSEKAFFVFYDVFGWHNNAGDKDKQCDVPQSNNTLEFFDRLHEALNGEFMIIMPNYLRDTPLTRKPDWGKFGDWWDTTGNIEKLLQEFNNTVIPFAKQEFNVSSAVCIGQCWGGNICFQQAAKDNDAVRGIVTLHAARITKPDFEALKKPFYYVSTKGDFDFDKEGMQDVVSKKDFAKLCKHEKCPDDDAERQHGFTSSGGKFKDEKWVKEKLQPVIDEIVKFSAAVYADKK